MSSDIVIVLSPFTVAMLLVFFSSIISLAFILLNIQRRQHYRLNHIASQVVLSAEMFQQYHQLLGEVISRIESKDFVEHDHE